MDRDLSQKCSMWNKTYSSILSPCREEKQIFTSHRYLLGCSGGVFTGIAQNPWDGDDEILFTSLDKAVDNITYSRLSVKTIYQCRLSIIDQKKR